MRVLHLTLKKKYFDMVGNGKTEEYRDIKKYWVQRLCDTHEGMIGGDFMDAHTVCAYTFKSFDIVEFTNGYGKNRPKKVFKFQSTEIDTGLQEWGAEPGKKYFVIKLGELLNPT